MKTLKIMLLLAFLFSSYSLNAQNVKIGFGGGINFSDVKYGENNLPEKSNLVCPRFSAFGDFKISEDFWIGSSIGYIQYGHSFKNYSQYHVKLNYLDITAALKYKYKNIYAFVGPTLGLYRSGTTNIEGHDEDIKSNEMQSPIFGMNFGAGYELPISNKVNLFLQSDYTIGLTDVVKESQTELKLNGLSFQLGFKFGL